MTAVIAKPEASGSRIARRAVTADPGRQSAAERPVDENEDLFDGAVVADGMPFAFDHHRCGGAASHLVIQAAQPGMRVMMPVQRRAASR